MFTKTAALLAGLLAPHLSLAGYCEPRNPDGFKAGKELQKFFEDAVAEFFPYQKGWEKGYNKYFSHDVKATFNDTRYDFDGLKGFFKNRAYPILHDGFNGTFEYGFTGLTAVPFLGATRGGWVTVTGWEYGLRHGNPDLPWNVTNAAYCIVEECDDCKLRFTEWRESSNLGFI